jgi:anti-sigma regulatory factor (Ser/Thr protein kinase)
MNPRILTVELVEELQQAAEAGLDVSSIVRSLTEASLPGLMEYSSARLHCPLLPDLSESIYQSELGRSNLEVRSLLGLRAEGPQKAPPRSLTPHNFEFIVVETEEEIVHRDWAEFLVRFRQSAKSAGFHFDRAKGLAAALDEMAGNAIVHANSPCGVLVGYQAMEGCALCCITDAGIGVLASLRTHPAYQGLDRHKDAIRVALRQGESRFGPGKGGLGFYRVFKSLAAMWGTLRFRSGEGCIEMDGRDFDSDRGEESFVQFRPGFQVTICCRTSGDIDDSPLI